MTQMAKRNTIYLISFFLTCIVVGIVGYGIYFLFTRLGSSAVIYFAINFIFVLFTAIFAPTPDKKLCYILIEVCLSFFGMALILYLAIKKLFVKNYKLSKKVINPNEKLVGIDKSNADEGFKKLAKYIVSETDYGVFPLERAEFFPNSKLLWKDFIESISQASEYVFIEAYIVKQGFCLSKLMAELYKLLLKNVRVCLFVDAYGTGSIDNELIAALIKKGAKVVNYKKPKLLLNLEDNFRAHGKITVVDGKMAYISSMNISDDSLSGQKECGIKLYGNAVKGVIDMFCELSGEDKEAFKLKNSVKGEGLILPFLSLGNGVLENVYLTMIGQANNSIEIITPYLSFGENLQNALLCALSCKIKVRIIVPSTVSKKKRDVVTSLYAKELIKMGAEVFAYKPNFLHQKLLVIDGKTALVGSANFDIRSSRYNSEGAAIIYNNRLIGEFLADFEKTLKDSFKLRSSDGELLLFGRIKHGFIKLFAPLV